jgi:hypothetical protein
MVKAMGSHSVGEALANVVRSGHAFNHITVLAFLFVACSEPTTPPLGQGESARRTLIGSQRALGLDLQTTPALSVDLSATGAFVPGRAVELTFAATALFDIADVEVELRLPEISLAERAGWQPSIPSNEFVVPVAAEVRRPLGRSETLRGGTAQVVLAAGYYRAVVVARARGAPSRDAAGLPIQPIAVRELWFYVTNSGGGVTDGYRPDLLPAGLPKRPGPSSSSTARPSAPAGATTQVTAAENQIGGYLKYYNIETATWVPIDGARIALTITDEYSGQIESIQNNYSFTEEGGRFDLECPAGQYDRYTYTFYLEDGLIVMDGGQTGGNFWQTDCGSEVLMSVASDWGHVFMNASLVRSISNSLYARQRTTPLHIRVGDFENSYYEKAGEGNNVNDRITVRNTTGGSHVWGLYGRFTIAHEFGHAFHHRALGNYPEPSCPHPHTMQGFEDPSCAYVEGFADYHAVATLGASTGELSNIESDYYYTNFHSSGDDGNHIEGAFAAFLLDLSDGADEPHDQLAGSVQYVGDLIATCEVYISSLSSWARNREPSHIVYCAENQVDSWVTGNYFLDSSWRPSTERESASEPVGWSVATVRSIWLKNLFGQ